MFRGVRIDRRSANRNFRPGTRWAESKWHRNAVDGTPRHAFVDAEKAFGENYRKAVSQSFKGRLCGGEPGLKFVFPR